MADGRSEAMWAHTSTVLCLIANVNRDPKKTSAFEPGDFNPHVQRAKGPAPKVKLRDIKDLLLGMKPSKG